MSNSGIEGGPVNCKTYRFIQKEVINPIVTNEGSATRKTIPLFRSSRYSADIIYHALVGSVNGSGEFLEETENAPDVPGKEGRAGLVQVLTRFNSWVWRNPAGQYNDAHIDLVPLPSRRDNLVLKEIAEIMKDKEAESLKNYLVDPGSKSLFAGSRICLSNPALPDNHDWIGLSLNGEMLFGYGRFGMIKDNSLPPILPGNEWNYPTDLRPYRFVPGEMNPSGRTDLEVQVAALTFSPDKRKKEYYKHSPFIGEVLKSGETFSLAISLGLNTDGSNYQEIAGKIEELIMEKPLTEGRLASVVRARISVQLAVSGTS